jgi:transcription antitermination factor NusA-like protein
VASDAGARALVSDTTLVSDTRVEALIRSIAAEEADPTALEPSKRARSLYDWEAWERLLRGEADARVKIVLLDLPDEVVRRAHERNLPVFRRLAEELRSLEARRVSPRYAYLVVVDAPANRLDIAYASSCGYMDALERVKERYAQLLRSLNDMLWDTVRYIEYAVVEAEAEEVRRKVLEYYSRIPIRYIDVVVYEDEVAIYVAKQLRGKIIGKQGATVKKLEEMIGRRVRVYSDPRFTETYEAEHPELKLPSDPETLQLLAQAVLLLEKLEERGVTLRMVERYIEMMRAEREEEEEW